MSKADQTLAVLRQAAQQHDSVVVAYSGGKDSVVVMDLCCRTFKRVEAFHMYLVPGMPSHERIAAYAMERWGVRVRSYPHWGSLLGLVHRAYVDPYEELDLLPEWKLQDLYQLAIDDTGCGFVAVGAKKSDSSWRRRFMKGTAHWDQVLNPIGEWNKFDVLGYIQSAGLSTLLSRMDKNASGFDLSLKSLQWAHDEHPDDFKAIREHFRYAEAAIWHREFFGATQ